ncbi:hypothetical protein [Paenibacillus senegalensis]|uniref:hypothetical protein n=1 Tax=Paenibacillus senegalensis TaxID=1465766 RepID=UPI00028A3425|nr:hypothetical protein [Paenibacillus senegalensis]
MPLTKGHPSAHSFQIDLTVEKMSLDQALEYLTELLNGAGLMHYRITPIDDTQDIRQRRAAGKYCSAPNDGEAKDLLEAEAESRHTPEGYSNDCQTSSVRNKTVISFSAEGNELQHKQINRVGASSEGIGRNSEATGRNSEEAASEGASLDGNNYLGQLSSREDADEIASQIEAYIANRKLVRVVVNRGRGVQESMPCRLINYRRQEKMLTVYHVDESRVYTFHLSEIDDFLIYE